MQKKPQCIWIGILIILAIYVGVALALIRSSLDIGCIVEKMLGFYRGVGFEITKNIGRAIFIALFSSCLTHVALIGCRSIEVGWPEIKESNARALFYCFSRCVIATFFCVFVIGALGDNISSRRASVINKELSILIGGLVLGGVVWLVNDFLGTLYNILKRRLG